MPAEHIHELDVLDEGRIKLNKAIDQANKSERDAASAIGTSNYALNISNQAKEASRQAKSDAEAALQYTVGKYLEPVDTFNDISTTYPNAVENDRVFVRDTGKVYIFQNGVWQEFSEITAGPVNEVDKRLTAQLAENVQRLKNENSNAEVPLNIPTYYRYDNHAVHPSVLYFETPKYGWRWVMAFTPYSEGRDVTENPSIVVSDDGYYWYVPNGLTNPLVDIPPPINTFYSDTEIIDNGTELEMWYRYTDKTIGKSQIWRRKSTNCVNWTSAELIFDFGQNGEDNYMSPTIIYDAGTYKLWYRSSKAGKIYYQESTNLTTWTTPQLCTFDYSNIEPHNEWHLQIRNFDGTYMAMINARQNSDNEHVLVYLKSTDGINFYDAKKLIRPSYNGWDNDRIYRASIVKYGGWYFIYYSGFSKDNSNYIGLAKGRVAYDLDELVGMKAADFNSVSTTYIDADFKRKGVEATGSGNLKITNTGIGGANIQPTNHARLTAFDESKTKKGFYEAAGYYFDSPGNTTVYRTENALYINPTTKGLNYFQDGALQPYARMIQMNIAGNSGDGSVGLRNGNDFFVSVVSVSAGLQINLKNMPTAFPFAFVVPRTSNSLQTSGGVRMGYIYVSSVSDTAIVIGLKENVSANHTPLNQITSGSIDVCIIF